MTTYVRARDAVAEWCDAIERAADATVPRWDVLQRLDAAHRDLADGCNGDRKGNFELHRGLPDGRAVLGALRRDLCVLVARAHDSDRVLDRAVDTVLIDLDVMLARALTLERVREDG